MSFIQRFVKTYLPNGWSTTIEAESRWWRCHAEVVVGKHPYGIWEGLGSRLQANPERLRSAGTIIASDGSRCQSRKGRGKW